MNLKKIIVLLLIVFIFVCQFIPLYTTISHMEYVNMGDYDDNMVNTRYFLKYAMGATGVNWYVQDCSDNSMVGEQVMVRTFIDPRFLSINKNYELDKNGILIVESSKKEKFIFDTQSVWRIYPKKVYIYLPDVSEEAKDYYFRHVSLFGYVKMFVGIFYPPWRYSY